MFEDSLIESGGRLRTKRGATTSASFLFQLALMVVLVLMPLLFTQALPKTQFMTSLVAPPPLAHVAAAAPRRTTTQIQSIPVHAQLRIPSRIPDHVQMIEDVVAPAAAIGVAGDAPGGLRQGVLNSILNSSQAAIPKVAAPHRVIVSRGVIQGMLLHRVQPAYPPLARQARIQGQVTLQAEISRDGSIQNLRVITGHPMLVPSALEAVKQWKYRPYILNEETVEVETTITVNFTLAGS
ncbi:MAG: periplasmic protein TonB [Acidobacteriaceae bacterium]|jgi:protein TonB